MEYNAKISVVDQAGVLAAIYSMVEKTKAAFGAAVAGVMLDVFGFVGGAGGGYP